MYQIKNARYGKVISEFLAVLLLAVVLFSSFCIAHETGHTCGGDNCPICACVQQCENALFQIGSAKVVGMLLLMPSRVVVFVTFFLTITLWHKTLVSRKVRLNH